MQVDVPQICWHEESARIMAIDFYPNSTYFVTCSQVNEFDSGIRFWKLNQVQQTQFGTSTIQTHVETENQKAAAAIAHFEPQH